MSDLNHIKKPIAEELAGFEKYFQNTMKTSVPLLNMVISYLLRRKGKQMRPILVFLTAKLFGRPNSSTYTAAALIEILHTATLIHDDVVDESYERRGFFSINAIWKSKVSVLLGDYLLAKGLLLAIKNKEYELLDIVAEAVREMSEGELLQLKNSRKHNITREEYYEIIRKKTATLIACCSACGAKSVGMSPEVVGKMQQFGELLGIAFQIKDDLLDYQINNLTGKPLGSDLREKKLTLPLIYALEQSNNHERADIRRLLNQRNRNRNNFNQILSFVEKNGGIEFARKEMHHFCDRALLIIEPFQDNEIKASLRTFVDYTILRNK
jgi:octaprenyl-diphosphate synthase